MRRDRLPSTAALVAAFGSSKSRYRAKPAEIVVRSALEPRRRPRRPNAMAAFVAELLFDLLRALVGGWLRDFAFAIGAWVDARIHNRRARLVIGLLLGAAAFFLIPAIVGLLGL